MQGECTEALRVLQAEIVSCERCPRLVAYREEIGRVRRRAFREQEYWSRPVPGWGDPGARLVIVGLAPAAHGGNRTGRPFTGDRSGDFLYRALWEASFANQPHSVARGDGLQLSDAYVTSPVRCAPPDNKPSREEMVACRGYMRRELDLLNGVRVVVALGSIALDAYLTILQERGRIRSRALFPFGHGRQYRPDPSGPLVLACYHPSQQNTSTRKLTADMLRDIFITARSVIEESG